MTNRFTDAKSRPCSSPADLPPLPRIEWSDIGQTAPTVKDLGTPDKDAPLPSADIVVITWTSTEWNALDHVFVNSGTEAHVSSEEFRKGWHLRSNDAEIKGAYNLWGFYKMVQISNANGATLDVLLFKADAHLSHPPYAQGLVDMVSLIIAEAKPDRLYTIGTSGGASVNEKLGDTVVTNAGHLKIEHDINKSVKIDGGTVDLDGKTVSCSSWFPDTGLFDKVQDHLLFKLSSVVTPDYLAYMLCEAIHDDEAGDDSWDGKYTVADLTNSALENLNTPKGLNRQNVPLLTTDFYYIAAGDDAADYSALEMDDALIGLTAGSLGTDYVFIRNISDPIVPTTTRNGDTIPTELREAWSSQIYTRYGFYTSMNGALLTWATIAGDTDLGKT